MEIVDHAAAASETDDGRAQSAVPLPFLAVAVLALLFLPAPAHGTSIVAVRGPGHVAIAADGLVTSEDGPIGTKCKIRPCGDRAVYSITGHQTLTASAHAVDTYAIADRACAAGGAIDVIADRFVEVLGAELRLLFDIMTSEHQEDWARWVGTGERLHIATAIFVGATNGTPMIEQHVTIGIDGTIDGKRARCPGDCPPKATILFAGQTTVAKGARDLIRKMPGPQTPERVAVMLVEAQARATPDAVGGSISLLVVYPDGAEWIQRNREECADLEGSLRRRPHR